MKSMIQQRGETPRTRPPAGNVEEGICCPTCGAPDGRIVDSRHQAGVKRRRRICAQGHRYTTYESTTMPADRLLGLYRALTTFDRKMVMDLVERLARVGP